MPQVKRLTTNGVSAEVQLRDHVRKRDNRTMSGAHSSTRWSGCILGGLLLFAANAIAQTPSPNTHPSQSDVTIRVHLPNEQPPPYPIQVELMSASGIPITQSFTHGDGRADFRDVPEGTYRVRVSGSDYVTVMSDVFTILHNEHLHTENVHINAKPSPDQKPNNPISANELQVPEKARNLLQKALQQFDGGASDDAIQSLRAAIAIYPQYAQAYNNLGIVLISKDDTKGATDAFNNALKADNKFVPAMINLARLQLRERELPKAQASLETALTNEPLNPEALTLLANVQFFQGHYSEAVAAVNRLHAAPHSGFADAHLVAAEALQKTGNNQQAIEQCQFFLKESPNSPRAEQVRSAIKVLEARK
jgi:Tfp pilus assembly protein PilF